MDALSAHPGDVLRLIVRDAAGSVLLERDAKVSGVWRGCNNGVLTLVVVVPGGGVTEPDSAGAC